MVRAPQSVLERKSRPALLPHQAITATTLGSAGEGRDVPAAFLRPTTSRDLIVYPARSSSLSSRLAQHAARRLQGESPQARRRPRVRLRAPPQGVTLVLMRATKSRTPQPLPVSDRLPARPAAADVGHCAADPPGPGPSPWAPPRSPPTAGAPSPTTYAIRSQDSTIRPARPRQFIADATLPDNPTSVHTLNTSHAPTPGDVQPDGGNRPEAQPRKGSPIKLPRLRS
jgi:hypothetical protein